MELAFIIWGCVIVSAIVFTIIACTVIEKSKVKRWGATGNLFKYE